MKPNGYNHRHTPTVVTNHSRGRAILNPHLMPHMRHTATTRKVR